MRMWGISKGLGGQGWLPIASLGSISVGLQLRRVCLDPGPSFHLLHQPSQVCRQLGPGYYCIRPAGEVQCKTFQQIALFSGLTKGDYDAAISVVRLGVNLSLQFLDITANEIKVAKTASPDIMAPSDKRTQIQVIFDSAKERLQTDLGHAEMHQRMKCWGLSRLRARA
jgi:hypothetical protein